MEANEPEPEEREAPTSGSPRARWPAEHFPEEEEFEQQWGQPISQEPAYRARGGLRVILYLTPGPAWAAIILSLDHYLHRPPDNLDVIVIPLFMLMTLGMGLFDGLLASTVPKKDGKPARTALGLHAITFLLIQVAIGPLLALLMLGLLLLVAPDFLP